jgi:prefoldin subunit 5
MEDKSEIIRAIQSLAEDLNRQLRELRESVDDLRSAIEGRIETTVKITRCRTGIFSVCMSVAGVNVPQR